MNSEEAYEIAKEFAILVKSKFVSSRVFLFGSYVKNSQRLESDIDIAVILKDFNNKMEVQLDLMRLRRKIDSRIEPHPFREKDFNNSNPLAYEILETGHEIIL
jgi:predicted nucleotidyltransferase